MADRLRYTSVTIANGASLSGIADLGGEVLVGIIMPAAWTAASLTFQGAADKQDSADATFNNVYDTTGNEVTYTVSTSRHIIVDPAALIGCRHLKVRSGTSGSAVAQGAARVVGLVTRQAS